MSYLTYETIPADWCTRRGESSATGAEVIFLGKVRDHADGRSVRALTYEAYGTMAESQIAQIIQAARSRWPVREIGLLHRLGTLAVGEIAVALVVQAAHRDEAYQASRFVIDMLKQRVPIWKKEHFSDGTQAWSVGCDTGHGSHQAHSTRFANETA